MARLTSAPLAAALALLALHASDSSAQPPPPPPPPTTTLAAIMVENPFPDDAFADVEITLAIATKTTANVTVDFKKKPDAFSSSSCNVRSTFAMLKPGNVGTHPKQTPNGYDPNDEGADLKFVVAKYDKCYVTPRRRNSDDVFTDAQYYGGPGGAGTGLYEILESYGTNPTTSASAEFLPYEPPADAGNWSATNYPSLLRTDVVAGTFSLSENAAGAVSYSAELSLSSSSDCYDYTPATPSASTPETVELDTAFEFCRFIQSECHRASIMHRACKYFYFSILRQVSSSTITVTGTMVVGVPLPNIVPSRPFVTPAASDQDRVVIFQYCLQEQTFSEVVAAATISICKQQDHSECLSGDYIMVPLTPHPAHPRCSMIKFTMSTVGASGTISLDKFLKQRAEDGNDYLSARVQFVFRTESGGDTRFSAVHEDTRTSVNDKSLFDLEDVYPPPAPPPAPALSAGDLDTVFYEHDLATGSLTEIDFIRRRGKHFLVSNNQHLLCARVKFSGYTHFDLREGPFLTHTNSNISIGSQGAGAITGGEFLFSDEFSGHAGALQNDFFGTSVSTANLATKLRSVDPVSKDGQNSSCAHAAVCFALNRIAGYNNDTLFDGDGDTIRVNIEFEAHLYEDDAQRNRCLHIPALNSLASSSPRAAAAATASSVRIAVPATLEVLPPRNGAPPPGVLPGPAAKEDFGLAAALWLVSTALALTLAGLGSVRPASLQRRR